MLEVVLFLSNWKRNSKFHFEFQPFFFICSEVLWFSALIIVLADSFLSPLFQYNEHCPLLCCHPSVAGPFESSLGILINEAFHSCLPILLRCLVGFATESFDFYRFRWLIAAHGGTTSSAKAAVTQNPANVFPLIQHRGPSKQNI